jgi:hypothetical protein
VRLPPLLVSLASPYQVCLVIGDSEGFGPKARLQTQLGFLDVIS